MIFNIILCGFGYCVDVKIDIECDVDIMICDIDYYIGFIDCEIWLCVLGRIDGRNWK